MSTVSQTQTHNVQILYPPLSAHMSSIVIRMLEKAFMIMKEDATILSLHGITQHKSISKQLNITPEETSISRLPS